MNSKVLGIDADTGKLLYNERLERGALYSSVVMAEGSIYTPSARTAGYRSFCRWQGIQAVGPQLPRR